MSVTRDGAGRRYDLTASLHNATKRDYVARVVEYDKAECAVVASKFGADYWDGERRYGYGGYRYDGRWSTVAADLAQRYGLRAGHRVLDVGCGKGFLLYELARAVPGLIVSGVDVSTYAIAAAPDEVRPYLVEAGAAKLPYDDAQFDLVFSLGTLHNVGVADLFASIQEMERVGKRNRYIMVESYRDEREKANLLYWQLTCKSFYAVEDWEWIYAKTGYSGDYGFIFFT